MLGDISDSTRQLLFTLQKNTLTPPQYFEQRQDPLSYKFTGRLSEPKLIWNSHHIGIVDD